MKFGKWRWFWYTDPAVRPRRLDIGDGRRTSFTQGIVTGIVRFMQSLQR
jgi:hypothetical protein